MVTVSRLEAPSECLRQAVIRGWRRWVPIADPAAAMLTVHAPDSPVAARTVALRTTN